jgi:rhamnosyltransferase
MLQACRDLGTGEFLVGPKIYEINLEKCMPVFQPGKYIPKRLRIDDQNEGMFPSLCIISSGSALSAAAYRKLGPFREDYFIEYIDIEYCLRAVSQNVPVRPQGRSSDTATSTQQIMWHGDAITVPAMPCTACICTVPPGDCIG